jgi:hypothetical protein
MQPLNIAYKEWAAVCTALADGRQSILFRKGGIAEEGGTFVPEHARFWLYPTHFHEREPDGLKPGFNTSSMHSPGQITLSHMATVTDLAWIDQLDAALALDHRHIWSEATIRQRFHYRTPGLYLLTVQIHAAKPHVIVERPEYVGCKSWVHLAEPLAVIDPVAVVPTAAPR